MAAEIAKTLAQTDPKEHIALGDHVVRYPSDPPNPRHRYGLVVFEQRFGSQALAYLFSGDRFRVVSLEPAEISGVPWWLAGSSGKPARPKDGFWPAITVEVEVDGQIVRGLVPIHNFRNIVAPVG